MFDLYITLRLLYLELRNGFCSVSDCLPPGAGKANCRCGANDCRRDANRCRWRANGCRRDANRCRGVRMAVDGCEWLSVLKNRVVSILCANQCRLGMRISVGANANTHSITKLLQHTPTDQAQLILDELHGMLERGKIRSAPLYVRALVERNRLNEFVPAAGISITARRNKVTQETSTEQRPDAANRETGIQALQELRKRNTRKK